MPAKPYIKVLDKIDDFTVWQVDGMYIRNNLNREFTNFGQHFRFQFIPVHEFWIDKEYGTDESAFFISHMILEWYLMHEGKSYDYAIERADTLEASERKKYSRPLADLNGKTLGEKPPKDLYREKIYQADNLAVWVVNGELVRDLYFIDFTEGGHEFVYDFVPKGEVWIDDDLNPDERYFVLLHELHERALMHAGDDYFKAHNSSSAIEYKCRKNPQLLETLLTEEFSKNASIK